MISNSIAAKPSEKAATSSNISGTGSSDFNGVALVRAASPATSKQWRIFRTWIFNFNRTRPAVNPTSPACQAGYIPTRQRGCVWLHHWNASGSHVGPWRAQQIRFRLSPIVRKNPPSVADWTGRLPAKVSPLTQANPRGQRHEPGWHIPGLRLPVQFHRQTEPPGRSWPGP